MKRNKLIKPIQGSILFLVFAALLGFVLRIAFVVDMPIGFEFSNFKHAHSHVALLGWLFAVFYLGIVYVFRLSSKRYIYLFWGLQFSVLGMLITFPLFGYALYSIIFSTLHIVLSYVFVIRLWKDLQSSSSSKMSKRFLKTSIMFLFISTFGPWALGPIAATGHKGSDLYVGVIQFYLHFQFNGWFVFAALAIFFEILNNKNITVHLKNQTIFYWTLLVSTILTFAYTGASTIPPTIIYLINCLGMVLQFIALFLLLKIIKPLIPSLKKIFSTYQQSVLLISLVAYAIKVTIQLIVIIPTVVDIAYSIRFFVVGVIHLLMLGFLSLFAFSTIETISSKPISKLGTIFFIIGIIITEVLLFSQGLLTWMSLGLISNYYFWMVIGSFFLLLGATLILLKTISWTKNKHL